MKFKFIEQTLKYDGSQLHSLFAYMKHGVQGDSMVAFIGACDIPFEYMVDGEDVLAQAQICGDEMLHFIIEEFGISMEMAVTRQRLLASIGMEELLKLSPQADLRRDGDDIYQGDAKLSISIATVTPVSGLIHFAMNVINDGTPVKTLSLTDLGLKPADVAFKIAHRFIDELKTIKEACSKVRWVK